MAKCDESWPNVRSLLVKEQFVNSCQSDVAVHLKEQARKDLAALAAFCRSVLVCPWNVFDFIKRKEPC